MFSRPSYSEYVDFDEIKKHYTTNQWDTLSFDEKKNEKARFEKHKLAVTMGKIFLLRTVLQKKEGIHIMFLLVL